MNTLSKWSIGCFLLLFGVLGLVATKVPEWIVPLAAVGAGVVVLVSTATSGGK